MARVELFCIHVYCCRLHICDLRLLSSQAATMVSCPSAVDGQSGGGTDPPWRTARSMMRSCLRVLLNHSVRRNLTSTAMLSADVVQKA